ncbi:MAG: BolA family protein [Pseudomonadota bacterium]
MSVADKMREKLESAFAPSSLSITDESEQHRGHSGYREGGETHFRIEIRSAGFAGMNRVARQRAVYDVLSEELAEQVHALSLSAEPE